MAINRYTQQTTAPTYDPMSMQELAYAPSILRQREDQTRASMMSMEDAAAQVVSSNPAIKDTLGRFRDTLNDSLTNLREKGQSPAAIDDLVQLKRRYNSEVVPINKFVASQSADLKARQSLLNQTGGQSFYTKAPATYEDWQKHGDEVFQSPIVNTPTIVKSLGTMFKGYANQPSGSSITAIANNKLLKIVQKTGLSSLPEVKNFLYNTEDGKIAMESVLQAHPELEGVDPDRVAGMFMEGAVEAMGKTTTEFRAIPQSSGGGKQTMSVMPRKETLTSAVDEHVSTAFTGKDFRDTIINASKVLNTPGATQEDIASAASYLKDFEVAKDAISKTNPKIRTLFKGEPKTSASVNKIFADNFGAGQEELGGEITKAFNAAVALAYTDKSWAGEVINRDDRQIDNFTGTVINKTLGTDLLSYIKKNNPKLTDSQAIDKFNTMNTKLRKALEGHLKTYDNWFDSKGGQKAFEAFDEEFSRNAIGSGEAVSFKKGEGRDTAMSIVGSLRSLGSSVIDTGFEIDGSDYDAVEGSDLTDKIGKSTLDSDSVKVLQGGNNIKPLIEATYIPKDGDKPVTVRYDIGIKKVPETYKQMALDSNNPELYYNAMTYVYGQELRKYKNPPSIAKLVFNNQNANPILAKIRVERVPGTRGGFKLYKMKEGKREYLRTISNGKNIGADIDALLAQYAPQNSFLNDFSQKVTQENATSKQKQAWGMQTISNLYNQ